MKLQKYLTILLLTLSLIFPLVIIAHKIFSGDIAFWYDPARDFLLARDNLHKLTLIGPTSGIPGFFYGPYWIWLLSFGLFFSQDPRIVIFLVSTLPYFILLPFLLWKFKKMFGVVTITILWLLFMFSTGMNYASSPWNPHPAPLLFVLLIYLIIITDFQEKGKSKYLKATAIGIVTGLIINFHISFGIGITFGTFIFLFLYNTARVLRKKKHENVNVMLKNYILPILCSIGGVIFIFLPFLFFELRHGFNQIQTAITVFTTKGSVVSLKGLSDSLIIQNYFDTLSSLLKLPLMYCFIFLILATAIIIYKYKNNKIKFSLQEIKLLLYLLTTSMTVLVVYLTSKNPVWSYHFIGVEIFFLFLIGIIISKIMFLRIILLVYICSTIALQIPGIITSFNRNPVAGVALASEVSLVKNINQDANGKPYTVFAYSPSIYIYEYTYLFDWLAQKDVPYDPGMVTKKEDTIYLIIPSSKPEIEEDFIKNKTPNKEYKTTKKWNIAGETSVLKRERYAEN
jgi:hypothetical protein